MCIALLSTAHPEYSLILIDNRDEFLTRPTSPAAWWTAPHSHVLGGRDLLRAEQGTWLGITRFGKIAVLTNFREDVTPSPTAVSRGALIKHFLTDEATTDTKEFVEKVVSSGAGHDAGGFSLVCGHVGQPLAVLSNRAKQDADVPWILEARGETVGLSNATFGDREWKKVTDGERLMGEAIHESVSEAETEDDLVTRMLALLSVDTLPRHAGEDAGLETYLTQLRHTIFVPAIGRPGTVHMPPDEIAAARKDERAAVLDQETQTAARLDVSGVYGTQKQTVVLVRHDGRARFVERTLYGDQAQPIFPGLGDLNFTFTVAR